MIIYAIEKLVNGKWRLFATPSSMEANNEDTMRRVAEKAAAQDIAGSYPPVTARQALEDGYRLTLYKADKTVPFKLKTKPKTGANPPSIAKAMLPRRGKGNKDADKRAAAAAKERANQRAAIAKAEADAKAAIAPTKT